MSNGVRSLVDRGSNATLKLHLQQFGVRSTVNHLPQLLNFVPHILNGHLHWSKDNLQYKKVGLKFALHLLS